MSYYHDDPVDHSRRRNPIFSSVLALVVLLAGAGFYLSSTLAANITLSSGGTIEFGQGVSQAVACSGETSLIVTPNSSFVNAANSTGTYYLESVKVSNIPDTCKGADFTINAFGNSDSTPLALFNSTSTSAVVYDNAGTFERGAGTVSGASITSGSGTFTITFTNPVALSTDVFKVTLQSGAHVAETCASGGTCVVGNTSPSGGIIYFVSADGFNCGTGYTSTGSPTGGQCHYLEAAPSGWNVGSDPTIVWAVSAYRSVVVSGISYDATAYNNALGIGLGYKNSVAIVNQGNNTTTAAGLARAYRGGSKSDWYLPTTAELNLLCQWVRGVAPSVTTPCTGGTLNSATYGANAAGFTGSYYWSSSEVPVATGYGQLSWEQYFFSGLQENRGKDNSFYLRPIRAF